MFAPAVLREADVVLMESTYGDRDHRSHAATLEELADILQQAHRDGGNVLMPSFAVGRTQDLIYYLGKFYREGRLPQQAVFLDSPMAIGANAIYSHFKDQLDLNGIAGSLGADSTGRYAERWLPILRATPTPEESMAINRFKSGAIIIAGSGMCNGGRILHHFKHNLWRNECHVVIPGFQARGTLGRAIVDGARSVKLLHQRIAVNAKVHTLGGFSAHAGQSQLSSGSATSTSAPSCISSMASKTRCRPCSRYCAIAWAGRRTFRNLAIVSPSDSHLAVAVQALRRPQDMEDGTCPSKQTITCPDTSRLAAPTSRNGSMNWSRWSSRKPARIWRCTGKCLSR